MRSGLSMAGRTQYKKTGRGDLVQAQGFVSDGITPLGHTERKEFERCPVRESLPYGLETLNLRRMTCLYF